MDRIYLLNPGQSLDAGDRRLTGFRPPLPLATAENAAEMRPDELRAAQLLWATIDSPWVHTVDPAKFAASFGPLRDFGPAAVLSTHLVA